MKRAIIFQLLLFLSGGLFAQFTVTGNVTDDTGETAIGATVIVKGTTNPLFYASNDELMAVSTFLTDAEDGDLRLNKVIAATSVTVDGLTGDHRVNLYLTADDDAIIMRNEELVLMYAEANIGSNNAEAVTAINVVRNAAGIGDYSGATDDAALTTELLHQRRYSLFGEGHRWVDMRRYDRLDELTIDRTGDIIHVQFPRPLQETIGG